LFNIVDQVVEYRFLPKKEYVHIVTDTKHKELLGYLGKKHGSMTKAFERAIDEYKDISNFLYQADPDLFRKAFHKQGIKFANAIKLLGKNDIGKMREIGLQVIPQLVRLTQRDPKSVSFLAEPNKFTIIFKTTDLTEMESMMAIFIAVMEGFGYQDIKPKIMENIVTIKFIRPQNIDVPKVEIKSEEDME